MRASAIAYVGRIAASSGGVVTREQLEAFVFEGHQIALIDKSRGIRSPRQLPATLTILTNPAGTYDDLVGGDGFPRYSIRRGDWAQGDNRKLHEAFEREVPLIWLQTITPGRFVATAPVFLVGADPVAGKYTVALDNEMRLGFKASTPLEARYAQALVKRRLHQPAFRARVIDAYRVRCAICALRHGSLLDAAHITPDAHDRGIPAVSNGLALCKIHHAAYDSDVLGIRPDYVVQVATDVLMEKDGPMLEHGLQAFHGQSLREIPGRRALRPDRDRLEERFALFRAAS
jgi:putative restriction endonuclease